ncbi:MAG TPA: glycoside hydrolase family 88 protein [Opitutaceae bacterium]|nr:glycoside hydrolase family 88 protein [Opitutaceae bacterium]
MKSRVECREICVFAPTTMDKTTAFFSPPACAVLMTLLMGGCQSTAPKGVTPGTASTGLSPSNAAGEIAWPAATEVREHMKAAFTPELKAALEAAQQHPEQANSWKPAAFYVGVSAAWQATGDEDYHQALKQWGESVKWQPAARVGNTRHADDICCGQAYIELYEREGGPERIAPIRARVDSFLAAPQPGRKDWWWCDALFMAPPVFVKLSQATGDAHYRAALAPIYWDAVDALWDEENHLFFRDQRFVGKPEKIFWARGNGWVLAGLARILDVLPADDPGRPRYEQLFKTLAARILQLQGADGAWRTNLVDAKQFPDPESSGTAFFAYGFAWGVNHGLLARADYGPAVLKAWAALVRAQLPSGQLGGVQSVGYQPGKPSPTDTAPYGGGAFLLLGAELLPPPAPHAG